MIKWFHRKFKFNDLEGTFPCLLERLQGTPLRLREKIAVIPPQYLTISLNETWTIKQQVGHLGDLEPLWETRFMDFLKGREILSAADLTNTQTNLAGHNQSDVQVLLENFEKKRRTLCSFMKSISHKAELWQSKHPRLLVPMRPIDLAYFVAEHDDHHLARITEIHLQLQNQSL